MSSLFTGILAIATPIIVVIGGIFLAYNQAKSNSSKVAAEVISTYKEKIAQLEETVKNLTASLKECQQTMIKFETAGREKDKQISDYKMIIANRNPELEKLLVEINTGLNTIGSFMQKIEGRMGFAEVELKKQTDMLKQ